VTQRDTARLAVAERVWARSGATCRDVTRPAPKQSPYILLQKKRPLAEPQFCVIDIKIMPR
jgi:hypothetical protein